MAQPHTRCSHIATRRRRRPRQMTLTINDNMLSLAALPPSKRKPRPTHTPAPHVVRRMANSPTYSTSDPAQSAFLRFPPEIRLLIYRLLLLYSATEPIAYSVGVVTARLVASVTNFSHNPDYPIKRHGLFPAILMCCRTTYQEGVAVLYGQNRFYIDCQKQGWEQIFNSWPLGASQMEAMTCLSMTFDHYLAGNIAHFPQLRSLYIYGFISVRELAMADLEMLRNISKVYIQIRVPFNEITRFNELCGLARRGSMAKPWAMTRKICLQEYLSAFQVAWGKRASAWGFEYRSNEYETDWDVGIHVN